MSAQNSLAIFTQAATMLAEANTIQKAKELKDLALTAADWARRKGMGQEAEQHCRNYAFDAERRMGEMLASTERAKPPSGKGKSRSDRRYPQGTDGAPTLAEIGITKKESSKAQALAALPPETYEEVKTGKKTRVQVRRETNLVAVKAAAKLPDAKYRVVYADPPWKYGDQLTENYGAVKYHYPAMTIKELCDMPIKKIVEKDAVLFLWVTSPLLEECFPIIKAWGFSYKTSFVWDKIKHNMGHYNSVRHEFLLVCTRGSCLPDVKKLHDSVLSIERSRRHSEKPEEFRKIIEELYPHGKRIEIFARKRSPGWEAYGNEC